MGRGRGLAAAEGHFQLVDAGDGRGGPEAGSATFLPAPAARPRASPDEMQTPELALDQKLPLPQRLRVELRPKSSTPTVLASSILAPGA
ncbi:Hypothetical protein SMAX5B_002117 [Scophthalmus maximus]|uniref:Uncharacterized protein n=1 Tax=Scophthalmus maximus TaxID=52904 RepID=A0A2U9AVB2_SCOMX|nr:Hypothetical protein SMAX5B_002117 [Scophthalmus maximus]